VSDLDTHAKAGISAINEGRIEDAITSFQQALALDPARPDLNNSLGMAYLHRGDAGNAVGFFEKAVALAEPFPDSEHAEMKRHFMSGLASAYQLLDRVDDAGRVFETMLDRWPDDHETLFQQAVLLLGSCRLIVGIEALRAAAERMTAEHRELADALVGSIEAFIDSEHSGDIFLRGHQESYKNYFDEISAEQVEQGWYAEAARMAKGEDGEFMPILAEGARPYAMSRVDLVNPKDGTIAGVYSEEEPMIVALNGLEPLAQAPIVFPWEAGYPFEIWVGSQCPWHWLTIQIQFVESETESALIERIDDVVGGWYLNGYNGEYGEKDSGRFHFISDPEVVGERAVTYTVDLGRARFDAIPSLLNALTVLHEKHRIQRALFGQGRLPG
jgi:tetratricopeptide (TPR) repeat protein